MSSKKAYEPNGRSRSNRAARSTAAIQRREAGRKQHFEATEIIRDELTETRVSWHMHDPPPPPPINYPSDPNNPMLLLAPPHLLPLAPVIWLPRPIEQRTQNDGELTHRPEVQAIPPSPRTPIMQDENSLQLKGNDCQLPHNFHRISEGGGPIRVLGSEGCIMHLVRDSPAPSSDDSREGPFPMR